MDEEGLTELENIYNVVPVEMETVPSHATLTERATEGMIGTGETTEKVLAGAPSAGVLGGVLSTTSTVMDVEEVGPALPEDPGKIQ